MLAVKAKKSTSDTLDLDREIDQIVYNFYRLTWEEITVVDRVFSAK